MNVYEIGESDGKGYIATELIEGHTLREQLSHKDSPQLSAVLKKCRADVGRAPPLRHAYSKFLDQGLAYVESIVRVR